jgi:hypothetical protein
VVPVEGQPVLVKPRPFERLSKLFPGECHILSRHFTPLRRQAAPTLPPSPALRGFESGQARTDARHQVPPPGTAAAAHERQEHVMHGLPRPARSRFEARR